MKIFTCIDHDGHFPVGVASVIVAKDRREARQLLDKELKAHSLRLYTEKKYKLSEVSLKIAQALILRDGDY